MIHDLLSRHPDYPRPTMFRSSYTLLNGTWDFAFDPDNKGMTLGFYQGFTPTNSIQVPFSYQTKASGINIQQACSIVWYQIQLTLSNRDHLLHFEGIDGYVHIWLNGHLLYEGLSGYARLSVKLKTYQFDKTNKLVIRVMDDFDTRKPRGKQRWQDENFGCWYVETTGIYKSVWLEPLANETYIDKLLLYPHSAERSLTCTVLLSESKPNLTVKISVFFKGILVTEQSILTSDITVTTLVSMRTLSGQFKLHFWTPETPSLYDLEIAVIDGTSIIDRIESYVGMKDITTLGSTLLLNHEPYYLKMILDQGYWPETGLTPLNLEALKTDIELMKASGFNGVRKHQKIEDERFYALTDMLGLLVWLEMPSHYEHDNVSMNRYIDLLPKVLDQYQNYQSIMTIVLFNESWGVPAIAFNKEQQTFTVACYHLAQAKSTGRLLIANDGWEHTLTDLATLHHYTQSADVLKDIYQNPDVMFHRLPHHHALPRLPFAQGYQYQGQPIIISEFAGIARVDDQGWGYGDKVTSLEGFHKRLYALTKTLLTLPHISGYCVTQLTDVEQETNGLFTADRQAKLSVKTYKQINEGLYEKL